MDRATLLAKMNMPATASLQDARARYKILAKRYHPDLPGGSADKMQRLNTLWDQIQRAFTQPDKPRASKTRPAPEDRQATYDLTEDNAWENDFYDLAVWTQLNKHMATYIKALKAQRVLGYLPKKAHLDIPAVRLQFHFPTTLLVTPTHKTFIYPQVPQTGYEQFAIAPKVQQKDPSTIRLMRPYSIFVDAMPEPGESSVSYIANGETLRVHYTKTEKKRAILFSTENPKDLLTYARRHPEGESLLRTVAKRLQKAQS